jgi:hypothetical protein
MIYGPRNHIIRHGFQRHSKYMKHEELKGGNSIMYINSKDSHKELESKHSRAMFTVQQLRSSPIYT